MRRRLWTLVVLVLISAPSVSAQTGTVVGRITDSQTGDSIQAAQVFIADSDFGSLTQISGRYLLLDVPVGTHTLTVAKIGYEAIQVQVTVVDGQAIERNFAISQAPQGREYTYSRVIRERIFVLPEDVNRVRRRR